MPPRPYVLLSCATSADGYLDDASPRRLILSGPADLDRVDEVRAGCDAIMVGAQTVRTDNPRLLIRDPRRRARRAARGLPEHPARAKPFSALNHFTVPLAMLFSLMRTVATAPALCERRVARPDQGPHQV